MGILSDLGTVDLGNHSNYHQDNHKQLHSHSLRNRLVLHSHERQHQHQAVQGTLTTTRGDARYVAQPYKAPTDNHA